MKPTLRNRSFIALGALAILLTSLGPTGAAAQSKAEVEEAEAAREEAYHALVDMQAEMDAAVAAYQAIRGQVAELEWRLERLAIRVSRDQAEAAQLQDLARELVIDAYINANPASMDVALGAASIQDVITSQVLIERASSSGIASLHRLDAVTRELERLTGDLEAEQILLDALQAKAQVAMEEVNLILEKVQVEFNRTDAAARDARRRWQAELERRRLAELARRRRAEARASGTAPVFSYLHCPQAQPMWFTNDWGNPRSGGRTHKGTDIFGAKGNKVYAVVGGTLSTRSGGIGGIGLWLRGTDGNSYYYAHLDRWASGISNGTKVSKGQVIAYVGNSGNAARGPAHTHFQVHPGGGSPVNPFPTLAAICNR